MKDRSVITFQDDIQISALISAEIQELPPVPAVALKLLQLTADENVKISKLTRVIETDPSLVAKILSITNSAAYQLPRRITSLQHAVTILGFSRIRQIALGLSLFHHLRRHLESSKFDLFHYWQHSLTVATLAKSLSHSLGYRDPDTAYVAGLLHDIGKLILEVYGKINYSDIVNSAEDSGALLIEEERKLTGTGHNEIGAYICSKWELPDSVTSAIALHHRDFTQTNLSDEDKRLVAIVSLADFIAWTQGIGSVKLSCPIALQPAVENFIDIEKLDLPAMLQELDDEISQIGQFYRLQFPTSNQLRGNLLRTTLELNRISSKCYIDANLTPPDSSMALVSESLLTPHHSHNPDNILVMTLEALHRELNYSVLVYLKADPDSRELIIQHTFPPDARSAYPDFQVKLTPNSGAFLDCLRTRSTAIAQGKTPAEQDALSRLNTDLLGLAAVAGSGRLMGMLAVIPATENQLVTTEALDGLGLVARELGLALEHAELFNSIKTQADIDPLTGIFNRRSFLSNLDRIIDENRNGQAAYAIGMADIDHFKEFNDNFGHIIGDKILRLIADTMKAENRSGDLIGRYGGDEFIFVLTSVTESEAVLFAERLRKAVEAKGKLLAKRFEGQTLSISLGLAMGSDAVNNKEDFIKSADSALYRAKQLGKNRVSI